VEKVGDCRACGDCRDLKIEIDLMWSSLVYQA
jgi:hypothetical protein